MNNEKRDIWDKHWSDLNKITEINPAQHYRHQILRKVLARIIGISHRPVTIIDFGSGQGDLICLLQRQFKDHRFTGLELSKVGVTISQNKMPLAKFYQCNLLENNPPLHQLYGSGEIGICAEVLEHLDNPVQMLKTIKMYLAPQARLIITVPGGPMNHFERSIGHRKHYTAAELRTLAEAVGFKVLTVTRAGFPFFNLYKIAALLRGERLREEANMRVEANRMLTIVLKIFGILFNFNLANSPFGWQIILIAENNNSQY